MRSQKQAVAGQTILNLSLLEVAVCQSSIKSELKPAGDRQSEAQLMDFSVPEYKNTIWTVNNLALRSIFPHLGTTIRSVSDVSVQKYFS